MKFVAAIVTLRIMPIDCFVSRSSDSLYDIVLSFIGYQSPGRKVAIARYLDVRVAAIRDRYFGITVKKSPVSLTHTVVTLLVRNNRSYNYTLTSRSSRPRRAISRLIFKPTRRSTKARLVILTSDRNPRHVDWRKTRLFKTSGRIRLLYSRNRGFIRLRPHGNETLVVQTRRF